MLAPAAAPELRRPPGPAAAPAPPAPAAGATGSARLATALLAAAAVPRLARAARSQRTAAPADPEPSESLCNVEDEYCEELEDQRNLQLEEESQVLRVSRAWSEGTWAADWGPEGPTWPSLVPDGRRRRNVGSVDGWRFDDALTIQTILRVVLPTVGALVGGAAIYAPICFWLQDMLDIGNTGRGPILQLLAMDQSQFMQNFLTVNGLLFTILCGNTYTSLYNQQEILFHALFVEVSEAKSLLEQACLVCQGRPFYPKMLDSIGDYVSTDLRRLDAEPAELLANRPMDDPLEYILYATSVGATWQSRRRGPIRQMCA
ncbi:unnamed protein product [Effrenium voratum]|nr:unnamed protein product [Effrenium voratum]